MYFVLSIGFHWGNKMIDTKTGNVSLDNGVQFGATTVVEDLSSQAEVEKVVENGIYQTYALRGVSLAGESIALLFMFEQNVLRSVDFGCSAGRSSWADVSVERERQRKRQNDQLLVKLLKARAPYKFSWGTIESTLDVKTGDASIVLRYR